MLSRDKDMPASLGLSRNNTLALTYDMQNTSTKLILLNFSNKDDNRIRGHETVKDNKTLLKSRYCDCLTDTTPNMAYHHRDRNISDYKKRSTTSFLDPSPLNNAVRLSSSKNPDRFNHSAKLAPSIATNKELDKGPRKNICHSSQLPGQRQGVSKRDLHILYSMPSLSHPDFTMDQRKVLLSLARIYTNVKPIKRVNHDLIHGEYKVRNQSFRSKEQNEKRSKDSAAWRNKRKDEDMKVYSLQTAVNIFSSDNKGRYLKCRDILENYGNTELDELLTEWIMNILQGQVTYLSNQRTHDINGDTTNLEEDDEWRLNTKTQIEKEREDNTYKIDIVNAKESDDNQGMENETSKQKSDEIKEMGDLFPFMMNCTNE